MDSTKVELRAVLKQQDGRWQLELISAEGDVKGKQILDQMIAEPDRNCATIMLLEVTGRDIEDMRLANPDSGHYTFNVVSGPDDRPEDVLRLLKEKDEKSKADAQAQNGRNKRLIGSGVKKGLELEDD